MEDRFCYSSIAVQDIRMLPAKAVDVEVESKVEQLEVVGNSSENLRTDREYTLTSFKLKL